MRNAILATILLCFFTFHENEIEFYYDDPEDYELEVYEYDQGYEELEIIYPIYHSQPMFPSVPSMFPNKIYGKSLKLPTYP